MIAVGSSHDEINVLKAVPVWLELMFWAVTYIVLKAMFST